MRKNGFTLIELLAVIVILAIIALIATPIILGIINEAREESNERSVELYASAVRNGIAAYQLREGKEILPGIYNETNKLPFEVEYDGNVVCEKTEIYENGGIYLEGCTVNGGEKTYNYGEQQLSELAKLCTANTTKAKALVWQGNDDPTLETSYAEEEVGLLASADGAYTPGVTYTCNFGETDDSKELIFFVLSSTENEVTLILGSNLGDGVEWGTGGNNHKDDIEDKQGEKAKSTLVERTSNWVSENGGKLTDAQSATIKLPTKDQIENAYEGTMPKWMYSYTKTPIAYGYWTSTPYADDSSSAWEVCYGGSVEYYDIGFSLIGIRPVITLSKS